MIFLFILMTGLTPIASVSESKYTDIIATNRIYYYVIVARNAIGNSSISNCESVTVEGPWQNKKIIPGFELFITIIGIITITIIYLRKKNFCKQLKS
ncbi:MAG: Heimdall-CTERM domain-containing surface protein [Promethearchaeota archaeon]